MDVADFAFGVDQVLGGPVLVAERAPGAEVVVLDDRIRDRVLLDRVGDVAGVALERELGGVDADDRQAAVAVLGVPRLHVRQRADAVDAGVGPEINQHNAVLMLGELVDRERLAADVEPLAGGDEVRSRAVVG